MSKKSKRLQEEEKMCQEALNQLIPENYRNLSPQEWLDHFNNIMVKDGCRVCLRHTNKLGEPIVILYRYGVINKFCKSIMFQIIYHDKIFVNIFKFWNMYSHPSRYFINPLDFPGYDDIPGDHFIMYR